MGKGILHNLVFTESPFKTISGDVTAFHRITGRNKATNEKLKVVFVLNVTFFTFSGGFHQHNFIGQFYIFCDVPS